MPPEQDREENEITEEQYQELVRLGVEAHEIEDMSMADAEEMIEQLRAMRRPPSAR